MKKIILAISLMLAVNAYSQDFMDKMVQSDTLVAGADTLVVDTLNAKYQYVYVTVSDTGATHTDSVAFESWDRKLQAWVRVGAVSMYDNSNISVTSSPNTVRMYLLNDTGIDILRQRLINVVYVAGRRVLTSLKLINR
jgi:hypothetical protein